MHRTQQRIANCRQNGMSQLQPPAVHQWWQQVEEGLRAAAHDPMQRQHCVPLRAPARLVALTANGLLEHAHTVAYTTRVFALCAYMWHLSIMTLSPAPP